jgi:Terpene cyclase DEP1
MRVVYLVLAIIGTVLPLSKLLPWLAQNGPDPRLMFQELFSFRIGAFFGFDVLISAVVLIIFIAREGAKQRMKLAWLPIAATCLIGVSCGLPLFLYLREGRRTLQEDAR